MSEPAQKCPINVILKQNLNLIPKLIIAFNMAYSCCCGLSGNIDLQISSKKVL